jgi:hypothetical protein
MNNAQGPSRRSVNFAPTQPPQRSSGSPSTSRHQGQNRAQGASDQDVFVTALEYQRITDRISASLVNRPAQARQFQDIVNEVNGLPPSTNKLKALFSRLKSVGGLLAAIGATMVFQLYNLGALADTSRAIAINRANGLIRDVLNYFG